MNLDDRGCELSGIGHPVHSVPPHTIFLLSPASLRGVRGRLILAEDGGSPLARAVRSADGAALEDVFSFVSSLYFRGKATYAHAFARPPSDVPGGLVISPSEGLQSLSERVTLARLQRWSAIPIDVGNHDFTAPLVDHAAALERAYGATTRFVLLGSVATEKYVAPLTRVFGDHLYFPVDFAGRGDMSRGSMLLTAARTGQELPYVPIEGARRHRSRSL